MNTCGTRYPVWMSSSLRGHDTDDYYGHSCTYPTVEVGVVERTSCTRSGSQFCNNAKAMDVVNCGPFFLWQLPDTYLCERDATVFPSAYCTT